MDASSTAAPLGQSLEVPAWKSVVNWGAALITAAIFLFSGFYKALEPYSFARLAQELLVPHALTMPLTWVLASVELLAGVMLLVPRFRKVGGALASLMLLVFMGYMALRYQELIGKDCSCFPVINLPLGLTLDFRTAVGPSFFVRDFFMLVPAVLATVWAKPFQGMRTAAVILGAVVVFVGVNYGVAYGKHNGVKAPEAVVVDGKTVNLQQGKYYIFFYSPVCQHCIAVSKELGTFKWKSGVTQIAVPTHDPQWAADFLKDAKWNAGTSLELQKLKTAFPFENPPYGVLLEDGIQTGATVVFEENNEPAVTLRKWGAIE